MGVIACRLLAACGRMRASDPYRVVQWVGDRVAERRHALGLTQEALAERLEVSVKYLTLRTPTLDDVFLELTGSHIEGSADDEETN